MEDVSAAAVVVCCIWPSGWGVFCECFCVAAAVVGVALCGGPPQQRLLLPNHLARRILSKSAAFAG